MKAKHKPPRAELRRRVEEELRYVQDAGGYGSTGIPVAPARVILIDIVSRELNGQISEARAQKLIEAFIEACMEAADDHRVTRDYIERRGGEVRAKRARAAKDARSENIDGIIWYHAGRLWEKKPKLKGNHLGTANAIELDVKKTLAANKLKTLGVQAIRKRVQKFKVGTSA